MASLVDASQGEMGRFSRSLKARCLHKRTDTHTHMPLENSSVMTACE